MAEARAYYNEIDPHAAHVLRFLAAEGLIAPGDVDDRSIKDVQPDDLEGYTQCHFFAGAGLWSVAARLAGWPDERPLWTGSCPCQGESVAGKRLGADDPRHLWPDFFRLIRASRPPVIMGEQVAAAAGGHWLDGVIADLEGENYAARAVDIPACAVDSPQIRSRLYWVSSSDMADSSGRAQLSGRPYEICSSTTSADGRIWPLQWSEFADADGGGLEHSASLGWREGRPEHELRSGWPASSGSDAPGRNGSAWAGSEWILCHDGKARRTEPGLRLLVDGMAGRIPAWRLGGNSISPILAAEVIGAFLDIEQQGTSP